VYTFNDVQVAKRSMSLRASYGGVATLATIWKGNTLLITWNRLNNSIMFDPVPYYLDEALGVEDEFILTQLVREFFAGTIRE
jgi:hypothetical protein